MPGMRLPPGSGETTGRLTGAIRGHLGAQTWLASTGNCGTCSSADAAGDVQRTPQERIGGTSGDVSTGTHLIDVIAAGSRHAVVHDDGDEHRRFGCGAPRGLRIYAPRGEHLAGDHRCRTVQKWQLVNHRIGCGDVCDADAGHGPLMVIIDLRIQADSESEDWERGALLEAAVTLATIDLRYEDRPYEPPLKRRPKDV